MRNRLIMIVLVLVIGSIALTSCQGGSLGGSGSEIIGPELGVVRLDSVRVRLTWTAVSGANNYVCYRGYGTDTPNEVVARFDNNVLTWIDGTLEPDASYTYQVSAEVGKAVGISASHYVGAVQRILFTSVLPIFQTACENCHGGAVPLGGWSVSELSNAITNRDFYTFRGTSGIPIIEPFTLHNSLLFARIQLTQNEPGHMPRNNVLPETSIHLIRKWISQGAPN